MLQFLLSGRGVCRETLKYPLVITAVCVWQISLVPASCDSTVKTFGLDWHLVAPVTMLELAHRIPRRCWRQFLNIITCIISSPLRRMTCKPSLPGKTFVVGRIWQREESRMQGHRHCYVWWTWKCIAVGAIHFCEDDAVELNPDSCPAILLMDIELNPDSSLALVAWRQAFWADIITLEVRVTNGKGAEAKI